MTPTPRTDAAETMWNDIGMMVVLATFARHLERELADWQVLQASTQARLEQAERGLAAERALADRLAGAIETHQRNFPDEALDGEKTLWAHLAAWREARRDP